MPRLLPPRSVGAALGICWDKEREPQLVGSLARLVATTGGRSPWEWLWGHGDLSYRSTVGVVTGSGSRNRGESKNPEGRIGWPVPAAQNLTLLPGRGTVDAHSRY